MAGVILDKVKKIYPGGVEAVKSASLNVHDGSFTVLLGPSGCGKSTLLRMIAGLEKISAGTISIGNRVVNEIEPSERDIAMVFQNYALYPHMSVYDNMAYGLRNRKVPEAEIKRRVAEASGMLAIEEYLTRKPRALSGGQRQRVAMGRAIVREPQVFLFDEPLSNLDAKLRVQMRLEIRRLHQRLKATSIFVTHDQVEAMTLADTVVVMSKGEIQQVGSPTDVYRRPRTVFVATFIGSPAMNMLPGRVVAQGQVEVAGAGRLPFDADEFPAAQGTDVQVGVRPEEWTLAAGGAEGLPFVREFDEELGASKLVHGMVGGVAVVIAVPSGAHDPGPQATRVVAPQAAVTLFDPGTGVTLRRGQAVFTQD